MAVGGQYTVQLRAMIDTKGVLAQIAQIQKQAGKIMIGGAGATKGASGGIAAVGKEANRTAAGVRRLNSAVDTTGKSVKRVEGKKLAKTYSEVGKGAKQATSNVKGFGATTLDVTKKVIQFGAITAAIRGVTTGMGAMVMETFKLDSALTEFKKVSDLSGEGLEKYTKQAYEAGKQTAKTGVEMIEAATQFKKMGYGEQESMQLATTATMFQNIADAEISAGDAAKFINSQMKAFQGEFSSMHSNGERAQKVIDSVNEVANNYAVGTNDLQLALTKTSAAMGTFGNSFDQTLGIMTAGTEVMVGMPSQVARGWRTIAANISKAGEKNRVWSDSSKDVNIQMRKQNGEIKNTYEFLTDLYKGQDGVSKGWKELNKDQKTAIALELAGKNNQEKFLAVMNNFGTAIKATKTAEESHGSAMRENARYLDSLEGRVQALKSAWSRFSNAIVKSDTVKMAVSGLTKALDVLASKGGSSMLKIAGGITSFLLLGRGLNGMFGKGGILPRAFAGISKSAGGVGKATKEASKGVTAVGKASATVAKTGGKGAKALGLLRGVFAGGAVGWGILGAAGIAFGIYKLNKYLTEKYDPDNIYAKTKADLDKYTSSLEKNQKEQDKIEKKKKKGTATESDERRLRQLEREERVIERQIQLQKKVEASAYGKKQRKVDKGVEDTDIYKDRYAKNRARYQTMNEQQVAAITKKEIGATDRLSSKYIKWSDSINQVVKAKQESQKAQEALNKAEESKDPQKMAKALDDLDKAYENETKALAGVTDGYVAMADKRDAILNKFGSIDKIPSYLQDSYMQLDKVVGALEDLQGMESFENLSNADFQKVIGDFKTLGEDAGIAFDKAGKINHINYDKFMATMESAGFMAEEVEAQLALIGQSNPEARVEIAGTEVAIGDVGKVNEYLNKFASGDASATIEIDGTEYAVKDIKSVDDLIEILDGTKGKAEIDADTQQANKKLKQTEKLADGATKNPYKFETKANTTQTDKKLKQTEKLSKGLTKKSPKIKVDSDTSNAEKGLNDVEQSVQVLDGKEAITWLRQHGAEIVKAEVDDAGNAVLTMPDGKKVTIKENGSKEGKKAVQNLVDVINRLRGKKVNVGAGVTGKGLVTSLKAAIDNLRDKTINIRVNRKGSVKNTLKGGGGHASEFASGTRNAPEGLAEVNEEGWEFIRDVKTGQLRVAGGGKRTITHLNEGDTVYTHAQSRRMLYDADRDIKIPQHASGKNNKSDKQKAQEAYDKAWEKRKTSYEKGLETIEYRAKMQHWSDVGLAKAQKAFYDKRIKALKKWNNSKGVKALKKKGAKVKNGFGTEAYRDRMTEREDAWHEQRISNIEKSLENFGRGIISSGKNKGTFDDVISTTNVADKEKSLTNLRKKKKISYEEYTKYLAEVRKAFLDNQMKLHEADRTSYKAMKGYLDSYVRAGKITWAEYYEYIEDLMDSQLDKEKKRLEKRQKLNDDTYSLARAGIERQIAERKKEIEATEEQNELIGKQNDLEKARSQRVKVYRQGKGFVYEQDTQAIKEATTALKDYKKEQDPQIKELEEILELFDDLEAQAEKVNLERLVGNTFEGLFGSYGTDKSQWELFAKKSLATKYGYENLLEKMDDLNGWRAIQAFLNSDGKVSQAIIDSYINKNKFASGSLSTPAGFARVGEQGYEIALFGKGDAIMPHNVSENLMAWGSHSPIEYASAMASTTSNAYHFDSLVLPNVTDANSLLNELNNLPNRALQYSKSRA